MSTDIVRTEFVITAEQTDLIKRTICKDSSDDELQLFLNQCKRTRLDPFSRQIHAVKRWDSSAGREVMQVQVGIDGFRIIADRTEEADGQEGPFWCGPDGKWVDSWLSDEPPAASMVRVFRKGQSKPYTGFARYGAYVQRKRDGKPNTFWNRMPDLMLSKCAEALALRKAFPNDLSGLYIPEEMGTDHNVQIAHEEQPPPEPVKPSEPKIDYVGIWTKRISEDPTLATVNSWLPEIRQLPEIPRKVIWGMVKAHVTAFGCVFDDTSKQFIQPPQQANTTMQEALEEQGTI